MKKIVLTMIALLSMTFAMAQNDEKRDGGNGPKQFTPEQMAENLAERLKLNDDQKAKVLQLTTEYKDYLRFPGMGGQRNGNRPGRNENAGEGGQRPERPQMTEEQRARFQENMKKRQEYEEKLKGILTEDQYQQYQQMRPGRGQRGGQRGNRQDRQ